MKANSKGSTLLGYFSRISTPKSLQISQKLYRHGKVFALILKNALKGTENGFKLFSPRTMVTLDDYLIYTKKLKVMSSL